MLVLDWFKFFFRCICVVLVGVLVSRLVLFDEMGCEAMETNRMARLAFDLLVHSLDIFFVLLVFGSLL